MYFVLVQATIAQLPGRKDSPGELFQSIVISKRFYVNHLTQPCLELPVGPTAREMYPRRINSNYREWQNVRKSNRKTPNRSN
ncbi:hypothetical protein NPIL_477181 [Nephila pilipes]|uniref:Uncharacterized protein n=1 Tax=Nephila pilipes TaxID=299642 RepID=A0A8X6PWV3_NEPPI|nr:hypothetical protein NPIL_477181 [Nephila pilipes]